MCRSRDWENEYLTLTRFPAPVSTLSSPSRSPGLWEWLIIILKTQRMVNYREQYDSTHSKVRPWQRETCETWEGLGRRELEAREARKAEVEDGEKSSIGGWGRCKEGSRNSSSSHRHGLRAAKADPGRILNLFQKLPGYIEAQWKGTAANVSESPALIPSYKFACRLIERLKSCRGSCSWRVAPRDRSQMTSFGSASIITGARSGNSCRSL